ncbi:NAD-dependent epimerase/dehydratase [Penicillium paradoxum]|uniref:NAD-dependent epimerase/dehydratase n=1 Tax=Penicillium paradoxum TaxID=176176 RepID=UPI0025496688|nr:NAD-dependent epimerase/dehydratase [Penicillium paradoxum]KAJ5780221.1 NAD-dependent epimerase/dehydratase [Penicillium paradoxum]
MQAYKLWNILDCGIYFLAAYYIQVTGARVLAGPEVDNGSYGEPSDRIFDDLDNSADLRNMI